MKSLTNKLVMSVLALVLTGVALSVGVLAWFTVNNTANIKQFSGTVQTGEGFYISADGATWVNTIDVSTLVNGVTFQGLTASTDGKTLSNLSGQTGTDIAGQFITFNLYFVGDDGLGSVNVTSITLESEAETSWIPGQEVPHTQSASDGNAPVKRSASDAARVAFIDLIATAANAIVFENPVGGTNTKGKGTLDLDNLALGMNQAVIYYNHFESNPPITQTMFNAAHAYSTVETGSPLTDETGSPLTQAITTLKTQTDPGAAALIAGIQGWNVPDAVTGVIGTDYVVGGVTVRVWIEGWDQEALNAILSGQINVTINFEAA